MSNHKKIKVGDLVHCLNGYFRVLETFDEGKRLGIQHHLADDKDKDSIFYDPFVERTILCQLVDQDFINKEMVALKKMEEYLKVIAKKAGVEIQSVTTLE